MRRYLSDDDTVEAIVNVILAGGNPTIRFGLTYLMHEKLEAAGCFTQKPYMCTRELSYIVDHGDFKTQQTWVPGQVVPRSVIL